jgi:hypothetical protein
MAKKYLLNAWELCFALSFFSFLNSGPTLAMRVLPLEPLHQAECLDVLNFLWTKYSEAS